ncbi:hypothetical protein KKJ09_06135 [Xenorhabdus bovienii]|uniref:murein biosynthesis integral membrane protein MurJ n=1 Tax=Xenorhabdus bovienii TaxID=40576 RepID=UPI0023B21438|nr:lipid II flippase MurJ [Xenorhabdus bovienii]MDE9493186.1 hypothetical protein [Xenorhabdus bovienii]MDE9501722.1 hypothetical protein [Xenorhabdus bovienii]MDE9525506.1 hypothetical protein [Xenorhabdus bovienii]MDE9568057.1 hypothetical protein [Xenorhabdus bovienii]
MNKLILSGIVVSFGLFIGRVSGFFRETFIASHYGASELTDLTILLLTTPDVLVNLLVGGALGMALIPEFKQVSENKAKILYKQVMLLLFLSFSLLTIILIIFSKAIMLLLAPGISEEMINISSYYFKISLISIPLTVAAGITTSYLNYKERFGLPAYGTLIFNIIIIIFLYSFTTENMIGVLKILTYGIIIASLLRWLILVVYSKTPPISSNCFESLYVNRELLRRYFYGVINGGIIFLIPVFVRAMASNSGEGILSLANYSLKLVDFPLGVVLTVFSIIFFPKLSELYANKNKEEFDKTLRKIFVAVMAISVGIFIPLYFLSEKFISLIYDWGKLTQEQLIIINDIFKAALIYLPFQGVNVLFTTAFAARRDTLTPLLVSTMIVMIFFSFNLIYKNGIYTVVNCMSLSYAIMTICLSLLLRLKQKVFIFNKDLFVETMKILLLALPYYLILSSNILSNLNTLLTIIIATAVGITFIFLCVLISKDFKQAIKI